MSEEKKIPVISEEIKGKYKMKKGFAAGIYHYRGYKIDTTSCSLEEADALVELKLDILEPVNPSKAEKPVEVKK